MPFIVGALLAIFVPLRYVLVPPLAALVLWASWKHPKWTVGLILALLPFQPFVTEVAQINGVPFAQAVSALKELCMLVAVLRLWRNRRWGWIESCAFLPLGIAAIWLVHNPTANAALGVKDDLEMFLPYLAGTVVLLDGSSVDSWKRRAIAILSIVALLGVVEFVFIGPAPRLALMEIEKESDIPSTFGAEGLDQFRAAGPLDSPVAMGELCAIGILLVISASEMNWILRGVALLSLAGGMISAVSRSSFLGLAAGLLFWLLRSQKRKGAILALMLVTAMAVIFFSSSTASDFARATVSRQDNSLQGHLETFAYAAGILASHPFGIGPGTVGIRAMTISGSAINVESAYLTLGVEYGVIVALSFALFCAGVLWVCWGGETEICTLGGSIMASHAAIMVFVAAQIGFSVSSWVFFPAGVAVLSARVQAGPGNKIGVPARRV
jgi:hypothetical protein